VSDIVLKLCDHWSGRGDLSRYAKGTVKMWLSSTGTVDSTILSRSGSPPDPLAVGAVVAIGLVASREMLLVAFERQYDREIDNSRDWLWK